MSTQLYKTLHNLTKLYKTLHNFTKLYNTTQNSTTTYKTLQIFALLTKLYTTLHNFTKLRAFDNTYQNFSKLYKRSYTSLQNCTALYTKHTIFIQLCKNKTIHIFTFLQNSTKQLHKSIQIYTTLHKFTNSSKLYKTLFTKLYKHR